MRIRGGPRPPIALGASAGLGSLVTFIGACAPASDPVRAQPPVGYFHVLHADPLQRRESLTCETAGMRACGRPDGASFLERNVNLAWAVETLAGSGFRLHLEMGADSALAWSEDAEMLDALAGSAPGGLEALSASNTEIRLQLTDALSRGDSLGSHNHAQARDAIGVWGHLVPEGPGPDPCEASRSHPVTDLEASALESLILDQALALDALIAKIGVEGATVDTLSGFAPRRLGNKARAIEDPDALDPLVGSLVPSTWKPVSPGPAFSECLDRIVNHVPFGPYRMDHDVALAAGEGPFVLPEIPVLGRLDEHFDHPLDSSLPAVQRQILVLLLNWRYDALVDAPPRPWLVSTGNHTFDLYPGEPGTKDPHGREAASDAGSAFRGDLLGLLDWLASLATSTSWHGVRAPEGVLATASPRALAAAYDAEEPFPAFSYVLSSDDGTAEPISTWDASLYPYLALPGERLARTHLACVGHLGEATVYGFLRCPDAWTWGRAAPGGFSCLQGATPEWVYLLLADEDACLPLPPGGPFLRSAAVDAVNLGPAATCSGGLDLPRQGLLVEAVGGGPLAAGGCPYQP
jgi:hypothetical protein